jgi:hypothetical protein
MAGNVIRELVGFHHVDVGQEDAVIPQADDIVALFEVNFDDLVTTNIAIILRTWNLQCQKTIK